MKPVHGKVQAMLTAKHRLLARRNADRFAPTKRQVQLLNKPNAIPIPTPKEATQ